MKSQSIIFSTLLLAVSGIVSASDLCDVPESEWQSIEALQQKLEAEGWTIKNIKVDDGCYEAYAKNSEGTRVEAYFDPKTFKMLKSEED